MAREYYKPGSFWRVDDRSGFKRRAENTRQEWTGLIVDDNLWEPRQPQDLVRGVKDIQSVALARPRQEDQFIRLGILTASSNLLCSSDDPCSEGNAAGSVYVASL